MITITVIIITYFLCLSTVFLNFLYGIFLFFYRSANPPARAGVGSQFFDKYLVELMCSFFSFKKNEPKSRAKGQGIAIPLSLCTPLTPKRLL